MALEKTLAIFGYPLGHTMSPTLHNRAAEALGEPYRFLAYEVEPAKFEAAVRGAQAMGFRGLCITIPHKVSAARLMDELSEDARLMGAVNVITFEPDGRMKGHNTDGMGWLRSLEEEMGTGPKGMRCLLLGSGGAARAIAVKIAQCGAAHIEIRNRTAEKAVALAKTVKEAFPALSIAGAGLDDLAGAAKDCQLIVNTTSQGMTGDAARMAALPLPEDVIPAGAICSDAVYNPAETAFLKAAKRRGARGLSGVGWLVHQGAIAWEMWTGTKMPVPQVREAVLKALGAK